MDAAGWAGIAGFANSLGNSLLQRDKDKREQEREERQYKLMQLQKDAQEERERFLIDYRIKAEQGAKEQEHERIKDDVVSQFKDPETGIWYGRTKSGKVVLLNETSDDYQGDLSTKRDLGNQRTQALIDKTQSGMDVDKARIGHMSVVDKDIASRTVHREQPKDNSQKIRDDYQKLVRQAQTDDAKAAAAAQKSGQPYTPVDPSHMEQGALARLYSVYGGQTVQKALGAQQDAPTQPQEAPPANDVLAKQPPQTSPVDPSAPSMQEIMMQANDALKRAGNDPAKKAAIEARVNELAKKYGYPIQ